MGYSIFKQNDVRYHPLAESEDKIAICRNPTESDVNSGSRNSRSTPSRFFLAPIAILLITSITLTFILLESTMAKNGCPNPRVRREWRMLERSERLEYLRAVQCLTQTQSSRDPRVSKQDDFTFLHSQYGSYSHDAAPFFPWHRYFIQAYENALTEHCGFNGTLPYWDWTRDYRYFYKSPIWNLDDGFGSNGESEVSDGDRFGNCVTSGPFANWSPAYFNGSYDPHCLSRQFMGDTTAAKVGNMTMKPQVLESAILEMSNYYDFLLHIEDMSHLTVPYLVQGDFRVPTAPNDPVFFLHHGQIDRIWWSWQRVSRDRFMQYNGKSRDTSEVEGHLKDILEFHSTILNATPSVSDVIDTEADGPLCYIYDMAIVE